MHFSSLNYLHLHCRIKSATIGLLSAQHNRSLAFRDTLNEVYSGVTIVSVSGNGQLLIGRYDDNERLYIYNYTNNTYLPSPLKLIPDTRLFDAIWTPGGKIVFTTTNHNGTNLVTITTSGRIVASYPVKSFANYLSVSTDGIIYVSTCAGVYQSSDDGLTWSSVFDTPRDSESICIMEAIRVSTDNDTDVFWALISLESDRFKSLWSLAEDRNILHVLNVKYSKGFYEQAQYDERVHATSTNPKIVSNLGRLVYHDRLATIFTTRKKHAALHMWSVSGLYGGELSMPEQFLTDDDRIYPKCITVDRRGHVTYMYVCYENSVEVFNLVY